MSQMMKKHVDVVRNELESIDGVKKVYFQPPSSVYLEYPCIIFELSNFSSHHANNNIYLDWPRFTVTVISKDPESCIPEKLKNIRGDFRTRFDRFFTFDNLNHWVYELTSTKLEN